MDKHNYFGLELLEPMANSTITNRNNLVDAQLQQSVVLVNPDVPRISSGFENQIGDNSNALLKADREYEVIKIIRRNVNYKLVVLKEKNKKYYHVVRIENSVNITETYGYLLEDNLKEGDVLKKNDTIYAPANTFDEYGNFGYGVNLRTMFSSNENKTYEDGVVISQSAADKMKTYSVTNVDVSLNENDILMNLYGDRKNYKSFPNIGEKVNGQILCARKRINYLTALFTLSTTSLTGDDNIDMVNDTVFYEQGEDVTVENIEIFSNRDLEHVSEFEYNKQIVDVLKEQNLYQSQIELALGEIIGDPANETSSDLQYEYYNNKCNLKWASDREFENMIIRFTLKKVRKLDIGNKVSNRYGSKGVISEIKSEHEGVEVSTIRPDDEMPMTPDGKRVEILLSPFSIVNRTNVAALKEHELNFTSDKVVEVMKKKNSEEAKAFFLKYLKIVNTKQHDLTEKYLGGLSESELDEFLQELYVTGIYLQIAPAYHNITLDTLIKLHTDLFENEGEYDKYEMTYSNGHKMEIPFVVADMYFIVLKHYAFGKFSARGSGGVNLLGVPNKAKTFKYKEALHSNTPIRIGEMENENLLLLKDVDKLTKFIKAYSSDTATRQDVIKQIINKGFVKELDVDNEKASNTVSIINEYFSMLGLELKE